MLLHEHENPLAQYDSIAPGSDRICVAYPALQEDHKDQMCFSHHLLKEKQANNDKKEKNSLCVQCTLILQTTEGWRSRPQHAPLSELHMQSEQGACARCQAANRYIDLARIECALRTKPWRLTGGNGGNLRPTAASGGTHGGKSCLHS